jgi:CRP-like cAMP-binding protein
MAKDRKIALLKEVPLFWGCSDKELKSIASITDPVDRPAGSVLMKEGATGAELWVIAKGTVKVTRKGRKIGSGGPGSAIGEMSLIDGGERTATVTAETPISGYVVSRRDFTTLLADAPSVSMKIMRGLAARLREAEKPGDTH